MDATSVLSASETTKVLPKKGVPANIYRADQPIHSSWWGSRGVFKKPIQFLTTAWQTIQNSSKPRFRRVPPQLNIFEAQSISAPAPPSKALPHGELTVGEVYLEMVSMKNSQDRSMDRYAENGGVIYPHIIVPDVGHPVRMSYIREVPSFWSKLNLFQSNENTRYGQTINPNNAPSPLNSILSFLNIQEDLPSLFSKIPATLKIPPSSKISSFGWHPYLARFCVSLKDDKIYTYNLLEDVWNGLVLQHEFQNDICCSEWRPNSGGMLAVGCRYGVCLWTIKLKKITKTQTTQTQQGPKQVSTSVSNQIDSSAEMQYLRFPQFAPVTCLSWSPCGRFLAVGSVNSSSVIVWDIHIGNNIILQPGIPAGVTVIQWSPNGRYLFAGGIKGTLRVWETMSWKHQAWDHENSVCQSACWSGNGSTLAVAFADESVIHFLYFPYSPPRIDGSHVLTSYVSKYEIKPSDSVPFQVCGRIQELTWDPTSQRLAVSFQDTALIALFSTETQPLGVHPIGLIRGPPDGGVPRLMRFCPHFKRGALLTSCWENGKVSFYPLYYKSNSETK